MKHKFNSSFLNVPIISFLVLFLIQIFKTFAIFRKVDLSSGFPLIPIDYILYYARILRAQEFLYRTGSFWGYDPYLQAGFISGPFLSVGLYGISHLSYFVSGFVQAGTFLLWLEFLSFLFFPFLLYPFVRKFVNHPAGIFLSIGLCIGIFMTWEMYTTTVMSGGTYWFAFSSFCSFWQVSSVMDWFEKRSYRNLCWMVVLTAILFQIHPASVAIIIFPNVYLFVRNFNKLGRKELVYLILGMFIVFISNWYWIKPFITFKDWFVEAHFLKSKDLRDIYRILFSNRFDLYGFLYAGINIIYLCLSIYYLKILRQLDKQRFTLIALWLLLLFVLAFFGSYIPVITKLQCRRFSIPFWILVSLLSGFGLFKIASERKWHQIYLVSGVILIMILGLVNYNKSVPLVQFSNTLRPYHTDLIKFILEKNSKGRWLIESSDRHKSWVTPYIAIVTKKPIIGGGSPADFLLTKFQNFNYYKYRKQEKYIDRPRLFANDIEIQSEESVIDYFELYNIEYIVAITRESKIVFDNYEALSVDNEKIPPYKIYRVNFDTHEWLLYGKGHVKFDFDTITIDNPSAERLLLKFHWIKTFKTDPPVPITPRYVLDDPVPFIEIDNSEGYSFIKIYNDK